MNEGKHFIPYIFHAKPYGSGFKTEPKKLFQTIIIQFSSNIQDKAQAQA